MLSLKEGKFLVELARRAIKDVFLNKRTVIDERKISSNLKEKRGVFVTLYKIENEQKKLRGCIGYPYPVLPLYEATINAAIQSAFNDPRFYPLRKEEMDKIIIEISILTKPKLVKAKSLEELLEKMVLGKHGIIVEKGPYSGLLLPQVPKEYNLTKKEFFYEACLKAGFVYDGDFSGIKVYFFEAEIFSEKEPNGEVVKLE